MERWILDARYALRRITRRPLAWSLAVLTLALGVGGLAAISGLTRSLLISPLPYPHAEQLTRMWMPGDWRGEEVAALDGHWTGFSAVAAYRPRNMTLEHAGALTRAVPGITGTADLFHVLEVAPALGHTFEPGDDRPGAAPVAVISNALWRELGADQEISGTPLTLDGTAYAVIGVMPSGFWFPDPGVQVWTNDTINATSSIGLYTLVGRMEPGRVVAGMGPALHQVTGVLRPLFDYSDPRWDITRNQVLTPFWNWMLGPLRPAIVALLVGMAAILLIACANVGALVIGQLEGRGAELAIRTALGADRSRLSAQLLIEILALGAAAGVVGSAIGVMGFRWLRVTLPLGVWGARATLDWTLLAAGIGAGVLASVVIASLSMLSLRRGELAAALANARALGGARRGGRLQNALVVAEVALAVLLAGSAGLLGHSVANLYAIKPGLAISDVAVIDAAAPLGAATADRRAMLRNVLSHLGELPGVRSVAVTQMLPLRGRDWSMGLRLPDQDPSAPTPLFRMVSAGYFEAFGISLREGRTWGGADRPDDSVRSIVVNESLARLYFPQTDPVGRVIPGGFGGPERIIGIAADAAEGNLTDRLSPTRYYWNEQVQFVPAGQTFIVRFAEPGAATRSGDALRLAVAAAAPSLAVQQVTPMERVLAQAVGPARDVLSLLGLLTTLALVLGAVGVYGVLSQFVTRRGRDWSLRLALGLRPTRLVGQILGRGVSLVFAGVVAGLVVTVASARLLAAFFFGITAYDPAALLGSAALLIGVGVAAALLPALRAGRADPAAVLKET
ncbi:MAG TPA: ABC transporter permease [Gemmatimonadales bacterium]|nr:ABC transporter permease [Gemmatimonadales bacterium]